MPPSWELTVHAKGVSHDAMFDDVRGITCQPKNLCGQATGEEIDRGCREVGVGCEEPREYVVAAPPEEKKCSEEDRAA